jgi:hypothetical protein
MANEYKNCQSCGMPLKRDKEGGGSNVDGSKSGAYCSNCYKDGEFSQPDITAKGMQARMQKEMGMYGIPGFLASFFTTGIPRLVRWKKSGRNKRR